MTAKEYYKTMWNPLYEDTDHKQFSYNELIEFAEGYKDQDKRKPTIESYNDNSVRGLDEYLP